ncbi:MAG TPA: hypothetical protein VF890_05410 [Gemmatimonadales bacterium]
MPVTAKLSQKFYAKLGDDVANELVNWFNQVDATYRADLRELNELNFARFDAKLEQRVAQLEAALARLEGSLIARIALAESRQTRLNLAAWIATLGAVAALIKL